MDEISQPESDERSQMTALLNSEAPQELPKIPSLSGLAGTPRVSDDSRLESILHRRDERTGRFVELRPGDRQLRFPFNKENMN
jgi:hypothetical protein